jgi:hypothetical protein
MRRVLLMAVAIAAFMCVGTTGAFAGDTPPGKPGDCKYGKDKSGKCKPKPCKYGKGSKCKPKPPKPPECKYGKTDDGKCLPPPVVVEPPSSGPCSQADLVLLEDLLKGTGALLCVYLGDNSPNADDAKDCPGALLALPIDNLLGACVFLPPADVESAAPETAAASTAPLSGTSGLTDLGSGPLQEILSMVTGLLKLPVVSAAR